MPFIIVFNVLAAITVARGDLYHECAKLFSPNNYMDRLPSLHLPYMGDVPIPFNTPRIKPSPVIKTKAISLVTKYLYKNPVCVKYTKKRTMCKPDVNIKNNNMEQIVTKEYFVRDRQKKFGEDGRYQKPADHYGRKEYDDTRSHRSQDLLNYDYEEEEEDYGDINLYLQSSENLRPFVKDNRTPNLSKKQIHEMLIEDRLDQLETILPHYTRRRIFETSTITVTKVLSNKRATATLTVKNCIPQGYDFCSAKVKKRKSKVAQLNNANESHYFG